MTLLTIPEAIAAWLWWNLVPFSVIGLGLILAEHLLAQRPRAQRWSFALLVVALVVSTGCTAALVAGRMTVVYDYCSGDIPRWLWWLTCLLN